MIEILRVDEDLEWSPFLVLGTLVQNNVVDRHVHGMIRNRGFYFVGRADQDLGALEFLMHANDFGAALGRFPAVLRLRCAFHFVARLVNRVADDLLVNFHPAHQSLPLMLRRPAGLRRQRVAVDSRGNQNFP